MLEITEKESGSSSDKVTPAPVVATPAPVVATPAPVTKVTCEDIKDKKQCKQSPTCKYKKGKGCGSVPVPTQCSDLPVENCRKGKNKKRCKIKKTKTKVNGKKVKTKTCVDK